MPTCSVAMLVVLSTSFFVATVDERQRARELKTIFFRVRLDSSMKRWEQRQTMKRGDWSAQHGGPGLGCNYLSICWYTVGAGALPRRLSPAYTAAASDTIHTTVVGIRRLVIWSGEFHRGKSWELMLMLVEWTFKLNSHHRSLGDNVEWDWCCSNSSCSGRRFTQETKKNKNEGKNTMSGGIINKVGIAVALPRVGMRQTIQNKEEWTKWQERKRYLLNVNSQRFPFSLIL